MTLARKIAEYSIPIAAGCIALVGCLWLSLVDPAPIQSARNLLFDVYQRIEPREYQPVPVRILDIDEDSLFRYGQWPWSRTIIQEVVEKLQAKGAAAIVFDIILAEPDRTSPQRLLRAYRDVEGVIDVLEDLPDHDQILSETIRRGRVVTAFALTGPSERLLKPRLKKGFAFAGEDPAQYLFPYQSSVNTLSPFELGAAGNGAINFIPTLDGVIRQAPIVLNLDGKLYPSLVTEALRVAQGDARLALKSTTASSENRLVGAPGLVAARIGQFTFDISRDGQIYMYYTHPVAERTVPLWQFMQTDQIPDSKIAGNIILIGTSAAGLLDLRFSPLGGVRPGVEMHAQALEQIMTGTYLTRPDWAKGAELALLLTLGLVIVLTTTLFGALTSAGVASIIFAMAVGASWFAFSDRQVLIDPLLPSALAVVVYLTTAIARYFTTEQKQKYIRKAFASYVSESIVKEVVAGGMELKTGGDKREMTFVFTDLEGFTSLIEKGDSEVLMPLLNEYLDGMVEIAFAHGGTLDKVIGDALSVFFSAPVHQPDHAQRAVDCAAAFDKYAEAFKAKQVEAGIPFGRTRIGVNSGVAIVGNFGGSGLFDYTAHGDPINTGARLESVNKQLGTRVLISETTLAQCEGFVGRPVASLVLKGKTKAVKVFEPLTEDHPGHAWREAYCAAYQAMEDEEEGARALFDDLLTAHPDDKLLALHVGRLKDGPVTANMVMDSK